MVYNNSSMIKIDLCLERKAGASIARVKYSFHQSDHVMTVQIPIEGLKKEQVMVETTDTTVCACQMFRIRLCRCHYFSYVCLEKYYQIAMIIYLK